MWLLTSPLSELFRPNSSLSVTKGGQLVLAQNFPTFWVWVMSPSIPPPLPRFVVANTNAKGNGNGGNGWAETLSFYLMAGLDRGFLRKCILLEEFPCCQQQGQNIDDESRPQTSINDKQTLLHLTFPRCLWEGIYQGQFSKERKRNAKKIL